jgi:uncharacterized protein YheU (UPF0270 family)
MDQKVEMVINQLRTRKVLIVWDLEMESSNIVMKRDVA